MLWSVALVSMVAAAAFAAEGGPPDGARLYRWNCAPCHGRDGHGDGPDADLFPERPRDLHDPALQRYDTGALVRRIREGRMLALPLDPKALRARLGETKAIEAHLRRLPALDSRAVRRGMVPYAAHCERCHGAFGEMTDTTVDLADPALQARLDDAAILATLRRGHGAMPPLAEPVPRRQEGDLLAFVRQLSPGSIRYFRYCAPCHGDDGHPPATVAGEFRRPTVVFDATYFSHVDAQDLQNAIWHMLDDKKPRMPHFAPLLDDAQIAAIIDYVRATPDGRAR